MAGYRCSRCQEEHDLADIEPSLRWPDAYLDLSERERTTRARAAKDMCIIDDGDKRRHFLRVLVPFPVEGRELPCSWGLWVEVAARHFERAAQLWTDPRQYEEPAFPGLVANAIEGYDETTGLPGLVSLVSPSSIPHFTFHGSVRHAFAQEQRRGVTEAKVLEWLLPILHPE